MGVEAAIARALANEDHDYAETRWSDARSTTPPPKHWPAERFGRRYADQRTLDVPCPPAQVFGAVLCLGGKKGWYAWTWLWSLRGLLDQLGGGVGSRRGRRDPACVIPGDTWTSGEWSRLEPDRLLLLAAEMRMPGRGWLQFELTPLADGQTRIVQTAMWDPVGLYGRLYWYSLWPAARGDLPRHDPRHSPGERLPYPAGPTPRHAHFDHALEMSDHVVHVDGDRHQRTAGSGDERRQLGMFGQESPRSNGSGVLVGQLRGRPRGGHGGGLLHVGVAVGATVEQQGHLRRRKQVAELARLAHGREHHLAQVLGGPERDQTRVGTGPRLGGENGEPLRDK